MNHDNYEMEQIIFDYLITYIPGITVRNHALNNRYIFLYYFQACNE